MQNKLIDPFSHIYAQCNNTEYENKVSVDFPRYMDIELTNYCNLNCLMCPTGNGMAERNKGFMSEDIFNIWFEQIKSYKTPIRFIRWGEPLLHPKFIEYVKRLKDEEILVHINTNGKLLDKKMCESIINVGLDSIKFSFQGVDRKSYSEMRNTDFFEQLMSNVELLYKMRGNRKKPFIHISTTTTYESEEQIIEFKKIAGKISDKVSVGKTVLEHIDLDKVSLPSREKEMLSKLKKKENLIKKHPKCYEVFDKLSIDWDGDVTACCGDYDKLMTLGNIKELSIKEIWNTKKLKVYRELLKNMQHDQIKLCSKCYEHIELTQEIQ